MSKALDEINFNDELPEDREELMANCSDYFQEFGLPFPIYQSWGQWLGMDEEDYDDLYSDEAPGIGDS